MNLDLLQRPFPAEQIKRRKNSLGLTFDYLETHSVILRLNEAFKGNWSFRIVEHKFLDDDVVVIAELAAEGVVKQQFGTCELNQETEDGMVFSMGDALKAAASDALKKAATLFGIGLQLYGAGITAAPAEKPAPETDAMEPPEAPPAPEEPEEAAADETDIDDLLAASESSQARITDMQLAEILDLARKRNFTRAQVDQRARSRYGHDLENLTSEEAESIIEKLRGR